MMKTLLMTEKKSRQTVRGRECCSALPSGAMVRLRRGTETEQRGRRDDRQPLKGLFHHTAGINLWSVPRSQIQQSSTAAHKSNILLQKMSQTLMMG